jgi:acetylornithine deacetylase
VTAVLDKTVELLRGLVALESTNPPRRPARLVEHVAGALRTGGLEVRVDDHGEGCFSVLATRGESRIVMNAHLDTVPIAPGWTRDPLALAVEGDRAYGLGACDVKGGAAAMIAAALATSSPCALLFTTDEEAGSATCITRFLDAKPDYELAIVAEPTRAKAVVAHRGIASGALRFEGRAGHASQKNVRSAVHGLVEWADAALDLARELGDVRFNIGRIEGGEKPNVIAARAEARFGVRPPPEMEPRGALRRFADLAVGASFEERFVAPSLRPTADGAAKRLGLAPGDPVDFWTEAALISAAGIPAIVLGPGDIAQAHGADEWVLLSDLDAAANAYVRVIGS